MNSDTAAGNCSRGPTPATAGEKTVHKRTADKFNGRADEKKDSEKGVHDAAKTPKGGNAEKHGRRQRTRCRAQQEAKRHQR